MRVYAERTLPLTGAELSEQVSFSDCPQGLGSEAGSYLPAGGGGTERQAQACHPPWMPFSRGMQCGLRRLTSFCGPSSVVLCLRGAAQTEGSQVGPPLPGPPRHTPPPLCDPGRPGSRLLPRLAPLLLRAHARVQKWLWQSSLRSYWDGTHEEHSGG